METEWMSFLPDSKLMKIFLWIGIGLFCQVWSTIIWKMGWFTFNFAIISIINANGHVLNFFIFIFYLFLTRFIRLTRPIKCTYISKITFFEKNLNVEIPGLFCTLQKKSIKSEFLQYKKWVFLIQSFDKSVKIINLNNRPV